VYKKIMIYIIGLQNPGLQFNHTRHNIGGAFVEWIYQHHSILSSWKKEKNLLHSIVEIGEKNVTLILPETFMNNSGEIAWFFKNISQKSSLGKSLFIAVDDMETEFSKVKLKVHEHKSPKGHNGLKSIKEHFGDIPNVLALGVGRPESHDPDTVNQHVLGRFSKQEQEKMEDIFSRTLTLFMHYKL
jgi:PTH1 family peptidyl-tRNA hydrolase